MKTNGSQRMAVISYNLQRTNPFLSLCCLHFIGFSNIKIQYQLPLLFPWRFASYHYHPQLPSLHCFLTIIVLVITHGRMLKTIVEYCLPHYWILLLLILWQGGLLPCHFFSFHEDTWVVASCPNPDKGILKRTEVNMKELRKIGSVTQEPVDILRGWSIKSLGHRG